MNSDRWQRFQTLYYSVIELAPDERTHFLQEACSGDPYMRQKVEAFLECEEKIGQFLEQTAIEVLVQMDGTDTSSLDLDDTNDLIGAIIADRYIVREYIGSGGTCHVYRAEHRLLGTPVAIKRLRSEFRDRQEHRRRFLEEARRAVSLDHDNVAQLKDVLEESGEVFLVMEFINGQTLRNRLNEPFELDQFLAIAIQCASALAAAHAQRIVHLDMKPENIMLTASQNVKVCDFGIARRLAEEGGDAEGESEPPWQFSGTPAYMAPEVLESNRFDVRADIFSLGVVFYEMLAGTHPFLLNDIKTTTNRILKETPPPLHLINRKLPRRLVRLIEHMLAKEPRKRLVSADEVVRELQIVRRHQGFFKNAWQRAGEMTATAARKPLPAFVIVLALVMAVTIPTVLAPEFFKRLMTSVKDDTTTLAVLPFRNVGGDPANQAFCDGLVETLTSKLSQIEPFQHAFRIVPASDVRLDEIGSARQAQRVLGAALVVTGSVQRMGGNIRLTVNLIDVRTQRQRDSRTIDADLRNLPSLQDDVAMKVAQLLNATLPQGARELLSSADPNMPAASDFYIQGRGYLQHYENADSVESAIQLFKHALELDGRYALAHAALGEAYWRKYELTKDLQLAELANRNCEAALKFNDRLSPVYVTLALIANGTGHYEDAIQQAQKSLEINFLEAGAYRELAKAYQNLGKLTEAESTHRRAIEARPGDWASHSALGLFYSQHGRYAEAETEFKAVLDLTPDNVRAYNNLGGLYQLMHRYQEAETMLKKSLAIRPTASGFSNLGTLYFFYLKNPTAAARMFEQAIQKSDHDYRYWRNLGAAYSWNPPEQEKAQAAFKKAIELGEQERQTNPRSQTLLVSLADCYAMVGESGRALDYVKQAMDVAPLNNSQMATVAGIHEQLGQRARALEWIGKALRGGYPRDLIDSSPSLAQLRSDPAFESLTKP